VVRGFQRNPQASVLVFKVLDDATGRLHLRDWCHPRSFAEFADQPFETYYIAEGACAFRREHFQRVGGYYEPFLIGGEGWDLALRMVDAGLSILYCPEVHVRHSMARETRSARRPYFYLTRNYIWTAYKDYAGWRRWRYLGYGLTVMAFFCFRTGNLRELFRGMRAGMKGRSAVPSTRISEQGWKRIRALKAQRPNLWKRLRTHWAQPEI
jgi:GT2 family glycosyltransferase